MRYQPLLTLIGSLCYVFTSAQESSTTHFFKVEKIKEINHFSVLTPSENALNNYLGNSNLLKGSYKENRSRFFLEETENGQQKPSVDFQTEKSTPICMCLIDHDTILIKAMSGFSDYAGVNIKVYKNNFDTWYIPSNNLYSLDSSNAQLGTVLKVAADTQTLVLHKKPSLKEEEQLFGVLSFSTKKYFKKIALNQFVPVMDKGKIMFTCKTRKKTFFDN